jgi:hypothetical protein
VPQTLVRSLRAALLIAACPLALQAQVGVPAARGQAPMRPRIGIGYAANLPNQMIGVTGHFVTPNVLGGLGVYVDAKFDTSSPRDEEGFEPDLTAEEVEDTRPDRLFTQEGSWQTVNVALMRPVTPQLVAYAGAGFSRGVEYNQYVDEEQELGRLGVYWVEDTERSGTFANFIGGVMFQLGENVAVQLGGESRPGGFTMGISYLLPLR